MLAPWMRVVVAALLLTAPAGSPRAAAAASPLMCQARQVPWTFPPLLIGFEALVAGGIAPFSYYWEFGDGGTSTEWNPSHQYTPGIYTATLAVTESGALEPSCRDTMRLILDDYYGTECSEWSDTRWGPAPLAVSFSWFPGPYMINAYPYSWRFGDGTWGTGENPSHVYTSPGTYYAVLTVGSDGSPNSDCSPPIRISAYDPEATSVGEQGGGPMHLDAPRPNPFGALTTIGFQLARSGRARLHIVDVRGRAVATLVDGYRPAGRQAAVWQGRSAAGGLAPAGIYFARLEFEGAMRSVRLARLR